MYLNSYKDKHIRTATYKNLHILFYTTPISPTFPSHTTPHPTMNTELESLRKQLEKAQELMEDAQDQLNLEQTEHNELKEKSTAALQKKDEEFQTQLRFQTQELERQKNANRKLERRMQNISSTNTSKTTNKNMQPTRNNENSRVDASRPLPHQQQQRHQQQQQQSSSFPNRKRKGTSSHSSSSSAWPQPGRKKGKMTDIQFEPPPPPIPTSSIPPPQTKTSSTSTSSSSSSTSSNNSNNNKNDDTANTSSTTVRTNHMWAQQREASRALTGHLSGAVKVLLGSAGYVEANLNGSGTGRSNILWTGGRYSRSTNKSSRRKSIGSGRRIPSSIGSGNDSSRVVANGRTVKLANELRDSADALYKCLMDLLAEQEREIEATVAPLFAMTAGK